MMRFKNASLGNVEILLECINECNIWGNSNHWSQWKILFFTSKYMQGSSLSLPFCLVGVFKFSVTHFFLNSHSICKDLSQNFIVKNAIKVSTIK